MWAKVAYHSTTVSSMLQANKCRGVSHTPWCERKTPIIPPPFHPCIHRKGVGAYRIRPPWRGSCTLNDGEMFAVVIAFPLIWGRMRYAPTHVRLLSRVNTINYYTCSVIVTGMLVYVIASFSPTSGHTPFTWTKNENNKTLKNFCFSACHFSRLH